jgi:small subunit ribosomal protein S6
LILKIAVCDQEVTGLETVAKRLYEGMFLVDSAQAAADWEGTLSFIDNILQRADAEVVSMRKWQERKLAYDIDHKTRGTYILCYFNASGERIAGIEKDVLLSEKVMRVLILTTEKRPAAMIEADLKSEPESKPAGAPAPAPVPAAVPASPAPASEEATAVAEQSGEPEKAGDGSSEQADAAPPEAEVAPTPEPEKADAAPPEAEVAPTPEPEKADAAPPEAAVAPEPEADTEETEKAAE